MIDLFSLFAGAVFGFLFGVCTMCLMFIVSDHNDEEERAHENI